MVLLVQDFAERGNDTFLGMATNIQEHRRFKRRDVQFSVLLSVIAEPEEVYSNRFCLGNIIDVSLGGASVQLNGSYDIASGVKVFLLVFSGKIDGGDDFRLPAEIRARVVWKREGGRFLGIRYM